MCNILSHPAVAPSSFVSCMTLEQHFFYESSYSFAGKVPILSTKAFSHYRISLTQGLTNKSPSNLTGGSIFLIMGNSAFLPSPFYIKLTPGWRLLAFKGHLMWNQGYCRTPGNILHKHHPLSPTSKAPFPILLNSSQWLLNKKDKCTT